VKSSSCKKQFGCNNEGEAESKGSASTSKVKFKIVVSTPLLVIPTNVATFIENVETKRYLFQDGPVIKAAQGAKGGWLANSRFVSPNVVKADANYYNRAYWIQRQVGQYYLIENLETKRYLFQDESMLTSNRGFEEGWANAPSVVGADANYYNRAYWRIIVTGEHYLFENVETKRYLLQDGPMIKGDHGADGEWLINSGFASPKVVKANSDYANRASWTIAKV
jgi:hypothetical protein